MHILLCHAVNCMQNYYLSEDYNLASADLTLKSPAYNLILGSVDFTLKSAGLLMNQPIIIFVQLIFVKILFN